MLGVCAEVDDCFQFVSCLKEVLVLRCCEVWICAAVEEGGFDVGCVEGCGDVSEVCDFVEGRS